ncbi:MAG: response regulator, partial [Spirulinaceae cyanobacterium RM2_2_10]|nr:response regulator [Spirulinaceae cyanobacterium RM2_2_10]
NDILDLAKIEARKLELSPHEIHVPSFLLSVIELISIRAQGKGIDFNYCPSPSLPSYVLADEKRLRQVLTNLLGNAVKFTDDGSVTLSVIWLGEAIPAGRTRTPPPTVRLRFEIQDTGVGMTEAQLQKIFLPFEQVGAQAKRSQGTGLGLAICCQIVEMMGSQIQVRSTLGAGSTFWFELDLPHVAEEQSAALVAENRGRIVGYRGDRQRILLVDDEPTNRLILMEILGNLGFILAEAGTGTEAVEAIATFHPNAVISDIVMSDMDGYTMARQIRQTISRDLTLIASSASVALSDRDRALEAGFNDFVPKPVDVEMMLASLQRHLHLEWLFEIIEVASEDRLENAELTFPEPADLQALWRAAKIGDIEGAIDEARHIKAQNLIYGAFCDRIIQLANDCDDTAIVQLLATANRL